MRKLSLALVAALATAVPAAVVAGPAHAKPPKPQAELVTKQPAAKFGSGKVSAGAFVKNRGNKKAEASVATFYLSTDKAAEQQRQGTRHCTGRQDQAEEVQAGERDLRRAGLRGHRHLSRGRVRGHGPRGQGAQRGQQLQGLEGHRGGHGDRAAQAGDDQLRGLTTGGPRFCRRGGHPRRLHHHRPGYWHGVLRGHCRRRHRHAHGLSTAADSAVQQLVRGRRATAPRPELS